MTQAQMNELSERMARMEVMHENTNKAVNDMATGINRLISKLDESDDVAKEALQSARSAHHRLNGHDRVIFWAATTIIGGLIVGAIGLIWKAVAV